MEQRIALRLQELEPLVAEYEELRRVAERLEFDVEAALKPAAAAKAKASAKPLASAPKKRAPKKRAAKPRAARKRAADARAQPGGTRAAGAQRRQRVIEIVQLRPGVTVPEISQELGVEPPPVYRVVRKLLADGTVVKEGTGLHPA